MIAYSRRALKALAYLFRPYNDIDVYVEDTNCRNMYEILINRILCGKAKVQRIFQLGGKQNVVDACAEDQEDAARPRLYIIDGDFDIALNTPRPSLKRLYRLCVYCSENLVVTPAAIVRVAYEYRPNDPAEEVERMLAIGPYLKEIIQTLTSLFVLYAVAHRVKWTRDTSTYNVMQLCMQESRHPRLSADKVNARVDMVLQGLVADHGESIYQLKREVEGRLSADVEDNARYISAKTYLLPLVYHYLREKTGFRGALDVLKVQLARHCDLTVDPGFADVVVQAATSE